MLTEEPCLKCHAKQGYKEGDIRGGISVSVSMDGQLAMLGTHLAETAGGHALIWALGMGGLVLGGRRLSRSIRETDQARVAAESANVAKSTFLATMSHEIRTPMSGVMGMLQLLKSTPLDQEQGQYVDLALQSSRYLLHILSDILDLSRIEAGALALRDEPFDGDDLVKPVVGALELEANGKGLALSVAMDRRLSSRLRGDAGRIRQVLFNLVGNAIKYTEQGQVRLELNLLPHRRASGQVCLHIVVADTGIGIPDGILHSVFEPFTQVDGSSTRRQGGAGLGLSIVKRLVGLMGGTLAVSSEPGRGTEVHVSLWLGTEAGEEHVAKPDGQAGASARRKILVAEDEAINRLAVVRRLEQLGCDAGQAVNGQEALALLGRETFDAVLMDVQMPIMSGIEATRRIRSGEVGSIDPNIPIIALTAYAMSGDREKFMEAGMDAYLSKPVDMDELIQILAAIKPSAP
jgi:signal transduction histidine kinase/ActR/RegA family two-component response regulator